MVLKYCQLIFDDGVWEARNGHLSIPRSTDRLRQPGVRPGHAKVRWGAGAYFLFVVLPPPSTFAHARYACGMSLRSEWIEEQMLPNRTVIGNLRCGKGETQQSPAMEQAAVTPLRNFGGVFKFILCPVVHDVVSNSCIPYPQHTTLIVSPRLLPIPRALDMTFGHNIRETMPTQRGAGLHLG